MMSTVCGIDSWVLSMRCIEFITFQPPASHIRWRVKRLQYFEGKRSCLVTDYALLSNRYSFHQDIKPHNILVFGNSPESEYDVDFRLSDLGLSHFHRLGEDGQDVAPITSRGTKQFGEYKSFGEF